MTLPASQRRAAATGERAGASSAQSSPTYRACRRGSQRDRANLRRNEGLGAASHGNFPATPRAALRSCSKAHLRLSMLKEPLDDDGY
eukprot:s1513_g2.t1